MTIDQYWDIVDRVHRASEGDMDAKCDLLGEELRKLPAAEVKSFSEHFDDCDDKAYSWELWAAAYLIGGGCSDDTFSDFRASLISTGRETFEQVVSNPETLADMNLTEEAAFYEGYQYVVNDVYEELTGEMLMRTKPAPKEPSGLPWEEDKVAEVYPRLAEKYGY